ncbi:hypothetical protein B0H17DRAFT_1047309 [Mycena rosella]|uniref:Uncharacterized protein n=1 Tax=Mycena rosella TaxID=1033263 RepID=A0AAD7DWB1_MYCRO|nr:hypothetical protein B0H17DRAFT_1047309 [Mycena rosella]
MEGLLSRWGHLFDFPSISNQAAVPLQQCQEAISKSPGLLRILHATQFLPAYGSLCFFKIVLGSMPWDDIRSIICPLRDLIAVEDGAKLESMFILMRERAKHLQWATEDKAMAHRCLQLLKDVGSRQTGLHFWNRTRPSWGLLIRITPPCLDLLQEIREFELPFWLCDYHPRYPPGLDPIDLHNVVQWLKTFSEPPLDVIHLWEGYFLKVYRLMIPSWNSEARQKESLKENMERQNRDYSFTDSLTLYLI